MLELRDDRRSVSSILENRLRAVGWSGWASFRAFLDVCGEFGLHVYDGQTARNRYAHFVGLDPKPPMRPDYFQEIGFVIETQPGSYVNRSNPAGVTTRRASARAWKTKRGAVGYCNRNGYEPSCVRHTKDLDASESPVAAAI